MSELIESDLKFAVISMCRSFHIDLHFGYFEGVYDEFKVQSPHLHVERILLKNKEGISSEEKELIENVDVLVTDPRIFFVKNIFDCLNNIKWIHMFTAGVEVLTKHYEGKEPPKFLLTRNSGFFDSQMVQYVIGQIIAKERLFKHLDQFQKQHVWKKIHFRPLDELTIGIVGYGSVGKKIAEQALHLEMKVIALVRKIPNDGYHHSVVENMSLTTDLSHLLRNSDYIVSILPGVSSTDGFFDDDVLKHCLNRKSVFINIGRGNVVKNESIIKALDKGWLSHAILDVLEKEPLPSDSPLWDRDDVTITPHISGSHFMPNKFVKKVLENYHKFRQGTLLDVVDWSKGY